MAGFSAPSISVVIPVHNGVGTLERCLAAVRPQLADGDEVIVVDDASTDDVADVVRRFDARLIRLDLQSGPAAARNRGAEHATRPVLFFVDADVVVHAEAIARGRAHFAAGTVDGVIGSYDDEPEARTAVSQFKNLAHHHFHQHAAGPIGSFWGACGFMTREMFNSVGGFDEGRFTRPSIEDVELGWRVTACGGRIVIDPLILVTHLKRWTLGSLIKTDVVYRAMPWVRWSLERRRFGGELNASPWQQIASLVAVLLVVTGMASMASPTAWLWFAAFLVSASVLNHRLLRLFWRKGGARLLIAGFALQQLYYLCALAGLVAGIVRFCWPGRRSVAAPPERVGA